MFSIILFIIVILSLFFINTMGFSRPKSLFTFRWIGLFTHFHLLVYCDSLCYHSTNNCQNHYCCHHNFSFFCGVAIRLLFNIILLTNLTFSFAKVMPIFWISATMAWQNDEYSLFFDTSQVTGAKRTDLWLNKGENKANSFEIPIIFCIFGV